jgi:integrative and conjugative element protein (TIGR02256 family)
MSRAFWHPGLSRRVVIGDAVLSVMRRHRQWPFFNEAGGLLFATIGQDAIHIVEATTPTRRDGCGSDYFEIDLNCAQSTIDERFQHGLHYVGEWHTHPVSRPVPSAKDRTTIASAFAKSKHGLQALILVIVGRRFDGEGLWVSLHNAKGSLRLCEANMDGTAN